MRHLLKKSLQGDQDKKELFVGSGWALLLRIAGIGATYFFTLWVTRSLGAAAIGVFAIGQRLLMIFALIGRAGLDNALVRLISEYRSKGEEGRIRDIYRKAVSYSFGNGIVFSLLLFFGASFLADSVFGNEGLASSIRVIALGVVPLILLMVNSGVLRGKKDVARFVGLRRVFPFLFGLLLLPAFMAGDLETDLIPVWSYVVGIFLACFLSFYWVFRVKGGILIGTEKGMAGKELLGLSIPMFLSASVFMVMNWIDILMLGAYTEEVQVGIYQVALRIAGLNTIMLFAVNSIAGPKFAEFSGKKDKAGLVKVLRRSGKMIFWASVPFIVLILMFPEFLLSIFGEEFSGGETALVILTIGQGVNALSGSVMNLLQMTGHQKAARNIVIMAASVNILLNLWLIPLYGVTGAAIANALGVIVWNMGSVVHVYRKFRLITLYFPGITRG